MFPNLSQALKWIEEGSNLRYLHDSKKFQRIKFLLDHLGRPQDKVKVIHIAGSKGKSSTAQALSFLLEQEGHRTGLFCSPHVHKYNERIQINKTMVPDDLFLSALNTLHKCIVQEQKNNHLFLPTTFEILLAAALFLFREQNVEFAIIEAGIGGLFDTSNILDPVLCIITNIEYEHKEILGDSIEEIAWQKSGIIKSETPVVLGEQQHKKATEIMQEQASQMRAPCYSYTDYIKGRVLSCTAQGMCIELEIDGPCLDKGKTELQTASVLSTITKNQMLSYLSCHVLALHKHIEEPRLRSRLELPPSAIAPCRAEIIPGDPQLYLDLAHTPLSLFYTLETAFTLFDKVVLLLGLSDDKDHNAISRILDPLLCREEQKIQKIYFTSTRSARSKNPQVLFQAFSHIPAISEKLVSMPESNNAFTSAMTLAQNTGSDIIICGSVFLCAHCRSLYHSGHHKNVS